MAYMNLQPTYRSNMQSQRHESNNNADVPIRTLYIAPLKPNMHNQVQEYFGKFGEVDLVRMHSRDDFYYGFVQFKMEESAQAALLIGSHRIGNRFAKVRPADVWHQPDIERKPVFEVPDQDSPHGYSNEIYRLVGEQLPNLVELSIENTLIGTDNTFQRNVVFVGQLKSLEVLKIHLQSYAMDSLVNSFASNAVPIKQMSLSDGTITDRAVEYISKLKSIEILELKEINSITDELLIELSKSLPALRELTLEKVPGQISTKAMKKVVAHGKKLTSLKLVEMNSIEIDEDDYKEIVKSVQSRAEKTKLAINIAGDGDKVEVPDAIQQQNLEWLFIDEQVKEDSEDEFDNSLESSLFHSSDDYFDDDDDDIHIFSDYELAHLSGLSDDENYPDLVRMGNGRFMFLG